MQSGAGVRQRPDEAYQAVGAEITDAAGAPAVIWSLEGACAVGLRSCRTKRGAALVGMLDLF